MGVLVLFEQRERTDNTDHLEGEGAYAYLDRAARVEARRIRELLTEMLGRYPEQHRSALIKRLQSPLDEAHCSAAFELLIHELLVKRGFKIAAVEQRIPGTSRSPDFLVEAVDGTRFYVEAATVMQYSKTEAAAQGRLAKAINTLNGIHSRTHYLSLHVSGAPTEPISSNKLASAFRAWIKKIASTEGRVGPFLFEVPRLRLSVTAKRRPQPSNARGGRSIGISSFAVRSIDPVADIRSTLRKKARHYGRPDLPFVIAVNSMGKGGVDGILDAIFGSVAVRGYRRPDGVLVSQNYRKRDGLGWPLQGNRVSAVLSFDDLTPWTASMRAGRHVRNATARLPLDVDFGMSAINLQQAGTKVLAPTYGAAVGLHANWPEDEAV